MEEKAITLYVELLARRPQIGSGDEFKKNAEKRLSLYKNKTPLRDE
jgi:hypothetical protein